MTKDRKEIGQRIRGIRKRLGMNQTEFGESLGVVTSSISAYEKGETSPKFDIVAKIARMGQTSIDDLLTGGGEDAPAYPDLYDMIKGQEDEQGIEPVDPETAPEIDLAKVEAALARASACCDYLLNNLGYGKLEQLLQGGNKLSEEDVRLLSVFHKLDAKRRKRLVEYAEDMVLAMAHHPA